jgi:steroid 5-alpha reductase family enzyme
MSEYVLIPFLLIFILQTCVFFWYLQTKNPTVVDVGWAGTTVVLAIVNVLMRVHQHSLGFFISFMIVLWGLRLGSFLYFTRILAHKVDQRYLYLAKDSSNHAWYFFKNFQLQGLLIYGLTMPLRVLPVSGTMTSWVIACAVVALLGLLLESYADFQLWMHQQQRVKSLCNTGLWSYSRHPNYFGDWVFWVGISLMPLSFDSGYSFLALISPLMLWAVMTKITGPLTEKLSLAKRPESYAEYQQKVPMFFLNLIKIIRDMKDLFFSKDKNF